MRTADRSRRVIALALIGLCAGCQRHETVEEARARGTEAFLLKQIGDLQGLIVKAESGQLSTRDRIAIGISEETARAVLNVSLPRDLTLAKRLRVRIESAECYFRGNNAALIFRATAQGATLAASAQLELGGSLESFKIASGKLTGRAQVTHFKVVDSTIGNVGSDVLEALVRESLGLITEQLPALVLPVKIEESIKVGGLQEGPVTVKAGELPLQITLAEVIPVNGRLWVLLEAKSGPWRSAAVASSK